MAKWANDQLMDDALNYLKTKATILTACLSQPADNAGALGTAALGTVGVATGNFTLANGDASGRKVTMSAATLTIGTTGTVTHLAFTGGGTLLFVGTCAPTSVTATGTLIVNAWDVTEIADPT